MLTKYQFNNEGRSVLRVGKASVLLEGRNYQQRQGKGAAEVRPVLLHPLAFLLCTVHSSTMKKNRNEFIPIWNEFIPDLISTIFHFFFCVDM